MAARERREKKLKNAENKKVRIDKRPLWLDSELIPRLWENFEN